MTHEVELEAIIRNKFSTGPARAIRRLGMVPAIIYGHGKENVAITIEEKEINKLYKQPQFITRVINFKIGNKKHKVLPKAIELHPITELVRHVDFIFVNDKKGGMQKMMVPIVFEGRSKSIGLKRGGYLNIIKRQILISCRADSLLQKISVDISNMQVGQAIKFEDLDLPEGVTVLEKPGFIATMLGSKLKTTDETSEDEAKESEAADEK